MTRIRKNHNQFTFNAKKTFADHPNSFVDAYSEITFTTGVGEDLIVEFGYVSNMGKRFTRKISTNPSQIIELQEFLTDYVEKNVNTVFLWININPFYSDLLNDNPYCKKMDVIKVEGFAYAVVPMKSNVSYATILAQKHINEQRSFYFPLYSIDKSKQHFIQSLYEENEREIGEYDEDKIYLNKNNRGNSYKPLTADIENILGRSHQETIIHYHSRDYIVTSPELTGDDQEAIFNQFLHAGLNTEQAGHNLQNLTNKCL